MKGLEAGVDSQSSRLGAGPRSPAEERGFQEVKAARSDGVDKLA